MEASRNRGRSAPRARVPYLNVAVDTIMLIEFGLGALSALSNLKSALTDAGTAKSVLDMEHASAEMAQTLVGTAAEIVMWAIQWGAGKLASRVLKHRQGQEFLDRYGNSSEAREALSDAKGDVAIAEKTLASQKPAGVPAPKPTEPPPTPKPTRPAPTPPGPTPKPTEPAPTPKPTEPAPAPKGETTTDEPSTKPTKPSTRSLDELEKELEAQGVSKEDVRKMAGGKRASAALAERVARLRGHFTAKDVKRLADFLQRQGRQLDDAAVDGSHRQR